MMGIGPWYRYSSYRRHYYGDPKKMAMAGCGLYCFFFGIFLILSGCIATAVAYAMGKEDDDENSPFNSDFFKRHRQNSPFNALKTIGPVMIGFGVLLIIVGIILVCTLRSASVSRQAKNLQPNQMIINGQIVTTGSDPNAAAPPNYGVGYTPGQHYPPAQQYPPAQAYPPAQGYPPSTVQPGQYPYQSQPMYPAQDPNPSAPPYYPEGQKGQTYTFVPKENIN